MPARKLVVLLPSTGALPALHLAPLPLPRLLAEHSEGSLDAINARATTITLILNEILAHPRFPMTA